MSKIVKGLLVKSESYIDSLKVLSVLTEEGLLRVAARSPQNITSRSLFNIQMFTYGEFDIYKSKTFNHLSDVSVIRSYDNLPSDPEAFALATYVCDLGTQMAYGSDENGSLLRLVLNTLYAIDNKMFSLEHIKTTFEAKIMAISGYQPLIEMCGNCGSRNGGFSFDVSQGMLVCKKCLSEDNSINDFRNLYNIDLSMISAWAFINKTDPKSVFNYKLSDSQIKDLGVITENFIIYTLDYKLQSLSVYKSIANTTF